MPSPIVAGTVIDSTYRIVRQIGAGGMGAVYEATHLVLGHRVAIKVLVGDLSESPGLLQRFINEARAASQSNHPGIVKVFDLGRLDGESGLPWLSMEYLDGQSLAARIHAASRRSGGAIGFDEFWIIGDIASALAAAHAKGIIHRDLKPGNVMVVPDPSTVWGERVKIVDFGIAKLLADADPVTRRGAVLGTPLYMAIEQFRDSAEVSGKADVFSLGVIGYELLAGRRPHNGQTHYEVMGARLMDPIVPVQQLVPSLPDGVAALVMRMLEREPENRPTMSEVDLEVRRLLGLPPPRQSGWHDAVVPTPTPDAGNVDGALPAKPAGIPQFDSNAPTPDIPAGAPAPSLVATPSAEKAMGELSPPSAVPIPILSPSPVPISISSMPSIPVPVSPSPPMIPEQSTAKPVPTRFIPEPVASASSPTRPQPRSRRWYWLGAAFAVVLAAGGGSLFLWPPRQPGQPATPVVVARPSPESAPQPAPKPPQPLPQPVMPTTAEQSPATAPTPPPEVSAPTDKARPSSRARCAAQLVNAGCIATQMAAKQKDSLASALQENGGVRLCPTERLMITGLPARPAIQGPASWLKRQTPNLFMDALRGLDGNYPDKIEIRCSK